jgi:hypothetical protein
MKLTRGDMSKIRKTLADHWGLSQAQVHVGTKGRVVIDKATDKTPGEGTGIVLWDEDDLYEYLEGQGL